jgi:hypothetical protein
MQAGKLALHPHELLGILNGLVFGFRHMTADEITALFRAGGITHARRSVIV